MHHSLTLGFAAALVFACAGNDRTPRSAAPPSDGGLCPIASARQALPPTPAASASSTIAQPKDTRFALGGTEVLQLPSKTNGRSYEISVGFAYKNEPGQRHPTVYVLDGYWDFPLVNTIRGALQYDEAIPDVIVVGIGYTGFDASAPELMDLRASDDTPTTSSKRLDSGRGPEFLRFIAEELFPFIESRYPSDPAHRVLAGASFGGLFTLYTLFERPELFYGYVAMSPAVRWDDSWIVRREREFHASHPALAARLWLSVGGDEDKEAMAAERAFFKQIEASKYRDFALRSRVLEGERHAAMKNESYNRGLRFVLAPLAAKPSK